MSKVIDIRGRLKSQNPSVLSKTHDGAEVLDMSEKRQEIIMAERRKVKRTILTEFIGAFAVIPQHGLQKVSLYDISETGLAFDLELDQGQFNMGEEIALRIYLNKTTYFNFIAKVINCRRIDDEGIFRHGVSFVPGTINDVALHHFIKFIENIAASLKSDAGDILVSGINK